MKLSPSRHSTHRALALLAIGLGAYLPAKLASRWFLQRVTVPTPAPSAERTPPVPSRQTAATSFSLPSHAQPPEPADITPASWSRDPYALPACPPRATLLAVAASEKPRWSMAFLVQDSKGFVLGSGDELPAGRVQFIAWDRIWLTREGNTCQLRLVEAADHQRQQAPLPSAWRRLVHVLTTASPMSRSIRLVPRQRDDRPALQVFGSPSSSAMAAFGLHQGDTLSNIGDRLLVDPSTTRASWQRGLDTDSLVFRLTRRGHALSSPMPTH